MGDRGEGAGRVERAARRASDRRGTARLDKVFPVWLEGLRGGCFGVARNISEGGMFIETRIRCRSAARSGSASPRNGAR